MLKKILINAVAIFSITNAFANESLLETNKRDQEFAEFVSRVDFSNKAFTVDYKVGTTSVGLKIIENDKYKAYWYPNENVSAKTEGQVVAYTLGRFLGVSEIMAPADYLQVSGDQLASLVEFLKNDKEDLDYVWKKQSLTDVMNAANENIKNKTAQLGAIVLKMDKFEVASLVDWQNNKFIADKPMAQFIRADQKQPSYTKIMNLEDFAPEEGEVNTSTELQLAKELSQIMVLDMLTGQWDRFSGGNLEARFEKGDVDPKIGRVHFFMRDNGGTRMDYDGTAEEDFKKYLSIVTRFDKEQIKKLELLATLLESNPEMIKTTLKMMSEVDVLKARVQAVLSHVSEQVEKYGEDKAFFKN